MSAIPQAPHTPDAHSMRVSFALSALPKSIFLAGPTPRDPQTPSWRPEALEILAKLGFSGTVFVPESLDWKSHDDYDGQIQWEWEALSQATAVAFWVPRNLASMPAFTTNVEFGYLAASGKCLFGRPPASPKNRYLDALAARHCIPVFTTLDGLLAAAVERAANPYPGDRRTGDRP